METTEPATGGHLEFYKRHGISPVRYESSGMSEHFQRRDALYRALGLPPIAFKGVRVLEVAPGSGQNSLYVAACRPASFELVEPNPTGRADIAAIYAAYSEPHTRPELFPTTLQDFKPSHLYDVVICENWLGSLPSEVALIRKLGSFVAPGGVLVITTVPLAGFFPNVMRKLLALRLVDEDLAFEERTNRLIDVFRPHLATIVGMTRSHRDWVHDCMINPHYLHVALPLATVIEAIGREFEVLATYPRISTDWRWFKRLVGPERRFNELALDAGLEQIVNFVDHRRERPALDADGARPLDRAFTRLYRAAVALQGAGLSPATPTSDSGVQSVAAALQEVATALGPLAPDLFPALQELLDVWGRRNLTPEDVRDMRDFGPLFGRETVYTSFTRPWGS